MRLQSISLIFCCFTGLYTLFIGCNTPKSQKNDNSYYSPLVDTILHHSHHNFSKLEKGGITFYYEKDAFFNKNIEKLADDALQSKALCTRLLGGQTPDYTLKVIYFNDREKLRPYLNMAPKGLALPDAFTLLIATNDSLRAYHTHELMHVLSINQLGGYAATPSNWIQEGISVYADSPCLGHPIHEIAAYLHHTRQMPSLDTLAQRFRTLPDMLAICTQVV
jgi:hypothetical protein